jgi:hypothetical protein
MESNPPRDSRCVLIADDEGGRGVTAAPYRNFADRPKVGSTQPRAEDGLNPHRTDRSRMPQKTHVKK